MEIEKSFYFFFHMVYFDNFHYCRGLDVVNKATSKIATA